MNISTKLLQAAAGQAGGAGLDVDEVFSTFVYEGNGSTGQSIVNGIDLSGEGGLVWAKSRESSSNHSWYDTVRGVQKALFSNSTGAEQSDASGGATKGLYQFNNNGFTVGDDWAAAINLNNDDMVSWTFRKAPKFFDIVTYTGNGTAGLTVNHNLGSVPGMIIVKATGLTSHWQVLHRNDGTNWKNLQLDQTGASGNEADYWGNGSSFVAPTSTAFTVGTGSNVNANGYTYIAYLFAHNNTDGGFGPDSDQDIIKCGGLTDGGADINLGFEPQFVLIKRTDQDSVNTSAGSRASRGNWVIADVMRSMPVSDQVDGLAANLSDAEIHEDFYIRPTPTGFSYDSLSYDGSGDFIYMAIRRGPLAAPEDATNVFAIGERGQNSPPPAYQAGFPVDMFTNRSDVTATTQWYTFDRLRGKIQTLFLDDTTSEQAYGGNAYAFDQMQGVGSSTNSDVNNYSWMWRRAPGYFDVVAYQGTGSAGFTFNHNLGVKPEMIWVKNRGASEYWAVYHKDLNGGTNPSHYYLKLNDTNAEFDYNEIWNDTEPTATQVTVGQQGVVNSSSFSHIAYLFATVAGVSKVGSYTGNGSTQNIDCGFSSGARFVLIKNTQRSRAWVTIDTTRGLQSGDDKVLYLNATTSELDLDFVDPHSSGFALSTSNDQVNENGKTYIFYAIA